MSIKSIRKMTENPRYEEEILLNVRRIMRSIDMYSSKLARLYGLTSPQFICLNKLCTEGAMTPGMLARLMNLSHATVTGIIFRLEKKGLIEKRRSSRDGRSFQISITEKGDSVLRAAPPLLQEHFLMELSRLAEWEKTFILTALQRVAHILGADSIKAAPVLTTGPIEASAENITEFLHYKPE